MPRVEIDGVPYMPAGEQAGLLREREETLLVLKGMWEEYGWDDWPGELHLADIIRLLDKHLAHELNQKEV